MVKGVIGLDIRAHVSGALDTWLGSTMIRCIGRFNRFKIIGIRSVGSGSTYMSNQTLSNEFGFGWVSVEM